MKPVLRAFSREQESDLDEQDDHYHHLPGETAGLAKLVDPEFIECAGGLQFLFDQAAIVGYAGTGRGHAVHSRIEHVAGKLRRGLRTRSAYKERARHSKPHHFVFATATGRADSRSNVATRLKRTVERANRGLAKQGASPIPIELSPHSLRRTFASLLYMRGESPVYVMHQMGHSDPKLALRIYAKVMGEQRRRGPGARLLSVLDGARWTRPESDVRSDATIAA